MRPRRRNRFLDESGQTLVLMLGMIAALVVGSLVLAAFGQALGGKSRHQRGADLASVSAATSMRDDYPRLFEADTLPNGLPNPRHLSTAQYLARARRVAVRIGGRNGVEVQEGDVSFSKGFAPARVSVSVSGTVEVTWAPVRNVAHAGP